MYKRTILSIIIFTGLIFAQNSIVKQFSSAIADVVEKANPAVVTISAEKVIKMDNQLEQFRGFPFFHPQLPDEGYSSRALGSGVIIDAKNGYIITNNHVIDDAEEIEITLIDKRVIPANILGTDPNSDLAVLQIDAKNISQLHFGDSDRLRVGEWVLAVGSPFSADLSHTVTAGIVSALGRGQVIRNADLYQDFIQTDAAINPGNSGGALLNLDGELIGINTAIATGGFDRSNKGVGFAIPANMIKKVLHDLVNKGYVIRSWLGVYIQQVDDEVARALDLSDRDGALISEIVSGSPAEKAGLKVQDIIREFNGEKITDTAHLKNVVSGTKPGKRSKVKIIRDGKWKTITIKLEELSQDETPTLAASNKNKSKLGFEVRNITDSIINQFDLNSDVTGVVVSEIDRRSNAFEAGVRVGDVITRVGTKKINSKRDFLKLIEDTKIRDSVLLLIKRGERSNFVAFEVE